jgi:hypothetical protein
MSALMVPHMVCQCVLHLEVYNYRIQDTTFLPNIRNTYKEKTKSYTYKPTKHILQKYQYKTKKSKEIHR